MEAVQDGAGMEEEFGGTFSEKTLKLQVCLGLPTIPTKTGLEKTPAIHFLCVPGASRCLSCAYQVWFHSALSSEHSDPDWPALGCDVGAKEN